MLESHELAARFDTHRPHLLAVARRLLGSPTEADDAVQEAWLRLDRTGDSGIANLGAWLTTVTSRICLDHLRQRSSRAEEPVDPVGPERGNDGPTPEDSVVLAESTAEAMAVVLDTLSPAERVAFVLHDIFDVPFDDIAAIIDRRPDATRQMASRARRRIRGQGGSVSYDRHRHEEAVTAFFRASRAGDLQGLLAVLAPNVVLRGDAMVLQMGSRTGWLTSDLAGAPAVADQFNGRAQAAVPATINGLPGAIWAPGGTARVAFRFTVVDGEITAIDLVADAEAMEKLDIAINPA